MKAYIDGLKAIAATLSGAPPLYHESVQMNNLVADGVTTPVIFAPALGIGKYTKAGGGFMPSLKIILEFLQQTQFENDLTANQTIIEAMESLSVDFMQKMNVSTLFQHPEEYETTYVYEKFDANFSGIALTFDLKLKQPLTSCV